MFKLQRPRRGGGLCSSNVLVSQRLPVDVYTDLLDLLGCSKSRRVTVSTCMVRDL